MYVTRTTLREALSRWRRGIARACRWRHDGAVIPGGKRGLSPVIPCCGRSRADEHLLHAAEGGCGIIEGSDERDWNHSE
jgi:hypothetical protein